MPAIRFVYFDLGNVLVSFDPTIACGNVARIFGVSAGVAERVIYGDGLQQRLERGELDGEEFAMAVRSAIATRRPPDGGSATMDAGGDPEAVATEAILSAISDMFTPIDAMRAAVESLRRRGTRLGILSNTCHAHWDWVCRQSYPVLSGRFDCHVLSYRERAMKPDAAIFEAAERAADVSPGEILFLDDRPENVAAAADRGWQAQACFGGPEAIGVLRRFGLTEGDRSMWRQGDVANERAGERMNGPANERAGE